MARELLASCEVGCLRRKDGTVVIPCNGTAIFLIACSTQAALSFLQTVCYPSSCLLFWPTQRTCSCSLQSARKILVAAGSLALGLQRPRCPLQSPPTMDLELNNQGYLFCKHILPGEGQTILHQRSTRHDECCRARSGRVLQVGENIHIANVGQLWGRKGKHHKTQKRVLTVPAKGTTTTDGLELKRGVLHRMVSEGNHLRPPRSRRRDGLEGCSATSASRSSSTFLVAMRVVGGFT